MQTLPRRRLPPAAQDALLQGIRQYLAEIRILPFILPARRCKSHNLPAFLAILYGHIQTAAYGGTQPVACTGSRTAFSCKGVQAGFQHRLHLLARFPPLLLPSAYGSAKDPGCHFLCSRQPGLFQEKGRLGRLLLCQGIKICPDFFPVHESQGTTGHLLVVPPLRGRHLHQDILVLLAVAQRIEQGTPDLLLCLGKLF